MTAISMRQQAANIGITDLSGGFLDAVLNPFWKASPANLALFPYRNGTAVSFRDMTEAWKWPTSYTWTTEWPDDSDNAPYANLFQGVCSDDEYWYFTFGGPKRWAPDVVPTLYPRSLATDLNADEVAHEHDHHLPNNVTDGHNIHFGDCCVHNGAVLVPVERGHGDEGLNILGAWKIQSQGPRLAWMDFAPLSGNPSYGEGGAWFATMKDTGLAFCSNFKTLPVKLNIYTIGVDTTAMTLNLTYVNTIPLYYPSGMPFNHTRIQGGAVSDRGHVYLVIDQMNTKGGGVYGFDLISGRQVKYIPIDGGDNPYELEGMCLVNLRAHAHDSSADGQLHVGRIDVDWYDNLSFLHFSVPVGEEDLI